MIRSYGMLIGFMGLALVVGIGCSDDPSGTGASGGTGGTGGTGGSTGGTGGSGTGGMGGMAGAGGMGGMAGAGGMGGMAGAGGMGGMAGAGGMGGMAGAGGMGGMGGVGGGVSCPPPTITGQAQTACRNSFNQLLSQFPVDYDITLDDCAFAGQAFNADVTPTLNFAESFLNTAAETLCGFGIDICTAGANFTDVQVRVDALAGATCTSQLSELGGTPVTLPLTCSSACPNPVVTASVAILLPTVTVPCTAGTAPGPVGMCATGVTPLVAAAGATGTQDVDTWAEVSIGFPFPVSFQCGDGLVSDGDIACTADTDCPDGTGGETPFPTGSCDVGEGTCNTVPLALDPTVDCATFPVEP